MCARTGRLEGGSFERSSEDGSPTRLESCRRGAVPPTPAAVPVPGGRSLAARETHFHVCPQHLSKQTAAVPRVPAPLAHLCASPIPGVPQRQNGIFVVVVMVLSHGDFGFCRISYQVVIWEACGIWGQCLSRAGSLLVWFLHDVGLSPCPISTLNSLSFR